MTNSICDDDALITTKLVAEGKRKEFLSKYLGTHSLRAERLTHEWMAELRGENVTLSWNYYELSNGSFYLAPAMKDQLWLTPKEGPECAMSADAAGVVVTLYVLDQFTCEMPPPSRRALFRMLDHFVFLHEFARSHTESQIIRVMLKPLGYK